MREQSHEGVPAFDDPPVDAFVDVNPARRPGWVLCGLLLAVVGLLFGGYAIARQKSGDGGSADAKKNAAAAPKKAAPGNQKGAKLDNPFPNRVKAPSLDGGTEWLNTSGEITMKDLRGKIVILDFWTYCCVNCLHVLPDLKYLEKKFRNELVVIGVHSAKFDNEKDSENIRKAIVRYGIEHPVINDAKMNVWRKFGAQAWPTLIIVDPEGNYCGYASGEGNRALLELVIEKLIAYHKAKGTLDRTPVRFALERKKLKPGPLKFPGKVLADEKSNRLFIADTSHNRVVVCTLAGKLLDVIGSGAMGKKDGTFADATFDHPQGMALAGNLLFLADTENHLIRKIDLKKRLVSTFAGSGKIDRERPSRGKLRAVGLNSPWAIVSVKGTLYVCMAGSHQVWSHKLGSDEISVFAGTGREDIIDGALRDSALAQPSGITTDGKSLYLADSEGSAIRKLDLDPDGKIRTIAGASDLPFGRALFEFGDKDGFGSDARLQHPLGVAYHNKALYVADSYNHKIRKIEFTPKGDKVTSWIGDGKRGTRLSPPRLSEPEGVSVAGGKLYIADTNNHRICVADLKTGKLSVLHIAGLKPPAENSGAAEPLSLDGAETINLKPVTVAAGNHVSIKVKVSLPDGFKLNKDFPTGFRLKVAAKQQLIAANFAAKRHDATVEKDGISLSLPLAAKTGETTITLTLSFGYCRAGTGGVCKLKTVRWRIPLAVSVKSKRKSIELQAVVEEQNSTKIEGIAPGR